MTCISAVIHTLNHGHCLGRAIESLHPCDEILVVDAGSTDNTAEVAQRFGARVVRKTGRAPKVNHDWVLCIRPDEALFEALEASLYDWKSVALDGPLAYRVAISEEFEGGWRELSPEVRFVHRGHVSWDHGMPRPLPGVDVGVLQGALARLFSY